MKITFNNPNDNWYYNNQYDKKSTSALKACLYCLAGIITAIIMSLLPSSCKNTEYIPVETVKTVYQNHTDTIKQVDSVFSEKETIIKEADSALVASLGLQLKDNEKAILILRKELEKKINKESEHRTDTVIQRDTIQVPYPVEKKLSKWETMCMDTGKILTILCILLLMFILLNVFLRKKRG